MFLWIIILLEILFIAYMIWDNVTWQADIRRRVGVPTPKKKIKLKKGQKIIFEAKENKYNPFDA